MEDPAVTIPDIRTLVAERQRFDDWLSALEARRGETPARVFERVHADYLARRDAVIENLHTHVGSLELLERDLKERLQKLESQLAEREDERAEAMLRTAVGEFDSERWETTRHEVEASLAQLGQDREALIAEADDVRGLLTSARHRPAAPEPEPVPLVVVSTESMEQELVSSNVAAAIAHADPAVAEHAIDLNAAGEITPHRTPAHDVSAQLITTDPYLRAVNARAAQSDSDIESAFAVSDPEFADLTGARETNMHGLGATTQHDVSVENERDTEANAAIDALGAPASSHQNDALDNIDVFGEPRATPRAGAPDVLPPRSINDPYAPRASVPNPETPKSATPQPPTGGARDGFDDLAFLRSITDSASGATSAGSGTTRTGGSTDQAKTLRCTECGTLNFPTEWYCERCGGELAAF